MRPLIMQLLHETVAHILLKARTFVFAFTHVGLLMDNYYTCTSFLKRLCDSGETGDHWAPFPGCQYWYCQNETLLCFSTHPTLSQNLPNHRGVWGQQLLKHYFQHDKNFKSSWEETEIPDASKASSRWQMNGRCSVTRLAEKLKSNERFRCYDNVACSKQGTIWQLHTVSSNSAWPFQQYTSITCLCFQQTCTELLGAMESVSADDIAYCIAPVLGYIMPSWNHFMA